ncbi:hypothetical protein ACOR62_00035 [Neisseria lisongii]|uniref:Uncharacterized protein n=1 Tax=Neisseria lisongii TaxID=2912188 RepID=A0AAW5AU94_9NEIS|nr:hypothetical protein [Neisseria lisongii]MCF7530590.1 hypothetical protein [Neisseria lisongii]
MKLAEVPQHSILLIDLDNTLVFTNKANNLAYKTALYRTKYGYLIYENLVEEFNGIDHSLRITEEKIWEAYIKYQSNNSIKEHIKQSILSAIKIKKEIYAQFLYFTEPNKLIIDFLNNHKKSILVTKSSQTRANETLSYYNLSDCFQERVFCHSSKFKYPYAIDYLYRNSIVLDNFSMNNIYIIDDDLCELENAMAYGIPKEHIFIP